MTFRSMLKERKRGLADRRYISLKKKLFVLGLPGSGKSTAARSIEQFAFHHDWVPTRFNDYDILYEMFKADPEGRQFSATQHGGFDVHDHTAFDDALKELEKRVRNAEKAATREKNEVIILEFARNDYSRALELFSPEFLENASFLFIDADIPTCKQRIRKRVDHPVYKDDHYVSEYIFEAYYQLDSRQYLKSVTSRLKTFCVINDVFIVDNTTSSSLQTFLESIEPFCASLFGTSVLGTKPASAIISPEDPTIPHDSYHETERPLVQS